MGLKSWFRAKARAAVDGLFCSSSPDVKRFGDDATGWVIHTRPMPQVCYCAGVGNEMTFELELAKVTERPMLVFDPSPTGVGDDGAERMRQPALFPCRHCGRNRHGGVLSARRQRRRLLLGRPRGQREDFVRVLEPGYIMSKNGDSAIDLLKMDIEGFEYDIVDGFLKDHIPVRQLCVEFHPWLRPGRTLKTIARLHRAGYRIIHKHRGDHTFLMNESR
jgi:hypothetical protein